ncbi:condensation domain-containing protein [Chitinophaga tropicalis]|uniref:Condensation domain-containing protein n=1 Tax=Chitinophaga tropicalis TaxID=2683588 RepID=A0A7K1UA10_9BACT|nr:condensation domain-containing protein [Chitinophaga tropicalis]MVT11138.1 hypothetical protein [Chitinophaga tropicalis]
MNRYLILGERIMFVEAGATVNCIFTAKVRGNIIPERLTNALKKVQDKHALLKVVIREDEKGRPYFVSDTQIPPIPVEIRERQSDNDWLAVSASEWHHSFQVRKMPLARVVWLRGEEVSELMLVCAHCICDGSSILTLMREILQVLDEPDTVLTPYEPFSSVQAFLPPALLANKWLRIKAGMIRAIAGIVLRLKTPRIKTPPGNSYMVHWKMDAEASRALVNRCREEKTSLHAAFSVAFLEAYQHVMGNAAKGRVICPVDIRRFLPELKKDQMFAFAPIAELSVEKDSTAGFWTKTRMLKNDLTAKIDGMNIHELLFMSEYFHSSAPQMIAFLKATEGNHDVTLSNMGKLDIPDNYNSFHLETIYSPSAGFPWRNPNTLVISTFRDQADFSFISGEHFLAEKDARAISDRMQALLEEKESVLQEL